MGHSSAKLIDELWQADCYDSKVAGESRSFASTRNRSQSPATEMSPLTLASGSRSRSNPANASQAYRLLVLPLASVTCLSLRSTHQVLFCLFHQTLLGRGMTVPFRLLT